MAWDGPPTGEFAGEGEEPGLEGLDPYPVGDGEPWLGEYGDDQLEAALGLENAEIPGALAEPETSDSDWEDLADWEDGNEGPEGGVPGEWDGAAQAPPRASSTQLPQPNPIGQNWRRGDTCIRQVLLPY